MKISKHNLGVGLLCLLLGLASSVAHAQGSTSEEFPRLLKPLLDSEVAISSLDLPSDADVVKAAGRPVVQLNSLDASLLRAAPAGLTLDLPNVPGGLKVSRQSNILVNADVDQQFADVSISSSSGGPEQQRLPAVWVGTVAGSRPGYSAVVLTHDAASNLVRGSVRFWDRRAGGFRVFRIAPAQQGPAASAAAAAAAAASADFAATAQAASPTAYMTMEIKEPKVVESHPARHEAEDQTSPAAVQKADTSSSVAAAAAAAAAAGTDDAAALRMLQPVAIAEGSYTPYMLLPDTSVTNNDVSDSPVAGLALAASDAGSSSSSSAGGSRKLQQSAAVQDALVVYTKLAADAVGGASALLGLVQQNFARANLAYRDSGVAMQLSLLAFRQWNYNEAGKQHTDILPAVMADAAVKQMREEVGADLVIAFDGGKYPAGGGFYCGLANIGGGANAAYSTIHGGVCLEGYTMAHEVGHNQGCAHAKEQGERDSPGMPGPYARGWRRCDWPASQRRSFNTIMAYQCPNVTGNTEIGLFSNPAIRTAAGIPSGDAAVGHCARALGQTAAAIANYRVRNGNLSPFPSPTPQSPSPPRPSPSPAPNTAPRTTWRTATGCDGTSAVLTCPAGTTIGILAIRLGRWNMSASVCPGAVPPAGSTPRSKGYFADLSRQSVSSFTMAADLVKALGDDPYPGANFRRQYEMTYACNTQYIFYPPGPQFCQGQIFTFTCPPGTKLHTSSLIMVGRWDNTKCPGAGVTAATPPMAKVYTWGIPAGRQSASLPADIVAAVKEDVYPGVAKQIAWYATCVMGR